MLQVVNIQLQLSDAQGLYVSLGIPRPDPQGYT